MVLRCDTGSCVRVLEVTPNDLTEAADLEAEGRVPDWAHAFARKAGWSVVDERLTYCPDHTISLSADDLNIDSSEVIDPDEEVGTFLEEQVELDKYSSIGYPDLYERYVDWCDNSNVAFSKIVFGRVMRAIFGDDIEMKRRSFRENGKVRTVWTVFGLAWKDGFTPETYKTKKDLELDNARLRVELLEATEAIGHFQQKIAALEETIEMLPTPIPTTTPEETL